MGFNCGIVGLPNVGKSTLFNALTETAAADAANYPFCTIEPNTGRVSVPDPRLDALAALANSVNVIPTQLEFVDIAGLVRGASKGEGLGNQFLANIREVDAIAHVLRCFEDSEITHVEGDVDPIRDAATIDTELMLADLDSLERRMATLVKKSRGGDAEAKSDLALMEKLFAQLSDGTPARRASGLTEAEAERLPYLQLLTSKPVLYVCNVAEGDAATGNDFSAKVAAHAAEEGARGHAVVHRPSRPNPLADLPNARHPDPCPGPEKQPRARFSVASGLEAQPAVAVDQGGQAALVGAGDGRAVRRV